MRRAGLSTVRFRVVVGEIAGPTWVYPVAMNIARRARSLAPDAEAAERIRVEAVVL